MIDIQLPFPSYLKKFLLHRFNSVDGRIYITSKKNYGIVLLKILEKNDKKENITKALSYNDTLHVKIGPYYFNTHGYFISQKNISFFVKSVKEEFENSLFDHITINLICNKDEKIEAVILKFVAFYGINESELSLDALKKAYHRHRKERNIRIIRA